LDASQRDVIIPAGSATVGLHREPRFPTAGVPGSGARLKVKRRELAKI